MTRRAAEASALNPQRRFLLEHIRFDKRIVRAQGHYYVDDQGAEYLDFLAQYGAVPFGHNPPELWETVHAHGHEHRPCFVQPLTSPAAEELAARLIELAPGAMRHVTFTNSGAETVEAAIKLARARTGRQVIVSTVRGYHGKTLGALSATDNPAYRAPFLLDTSAFERIPFDDLGALEARLATRDVAAFIVEPVQGEGGMRPASPGYLDAAAQICRRHGTLLAVDEVQTGLGRTGSLFACDRMQGAGPDMLLLSKALGGGLVPLGALLCTRSAWSDAFGLYHSSTFANSHFTCAVGCKVLELLTRDDRAIVRHAARMGESLQAGLDELVGRYPRAFAARTGMGLMQALVLAPWRGEGSYFTAHASDKGYAVPLLAGYLLNRHRIVTAPVFNQSATLRLEPSLTVTPAEVDRLLVALRSGAELIEREDFASLLDFVVDGASAPQSRPVVRASPPAKRPTPTFVAPSASERRRGSFAFLIHPTDDDVLFDTLPPDFAGLETERKAAWQRWMDSWFSRMYSPASVYHLAALRSQAGGYVEGWLIAAPLTPLRMMRLRKDEKAQLLSEYLGIARRLGVDIVGLGAFTSVIARGGMDVLDHGVNITNGNSLTAIASAESLRAVVAKHGSDLASEVVAVIGAGGSIGRLAALHLGRYCKELILLGNPDNPRSLEVLDDVAGEVYRNAASAALSRTDAGLPELLADIVGPVELAQLLDSVARSEPSRFKAEIERRLARAGHFDFPVVVSTDLPQHLRRAGAVLSASGAGKSFIDPQLFAPGCMVCDVARPLDVLGMVQAQRSDVFIYEGGVMRLPEHVAFGSQNVLGYPRGYNLACLSETMVLAMEGATRHYSVGSTMDYDQALSIFGKAMHHGFRFAVLEGGEEIALPGMRPSTPHAPSPAPARYKDPTPATAHEEQQP